MQSVSVFILHLATVRRWSFGRCGLFPAALILNNNVQEVEKAALRLKKSCSQNAMTRECKTCTVNVLKRTSLIFVGSAALLAWHL